VAVAVDMAVLRTRDAARCVVTTERLSRDALKALNAKRPTPSQASPSLRRRWPFYPTITPKDCDRFGRELR